MKAGTRDKVEGVFHEAKGRIKGISGKMTGKFELEVEGDNEKIGGKIQQN